MDDIKGWIGLSQLISELKNLKKQVGLLNFHRQTTITTTITSTDYLNKIASDEDNDVTGDDEGKYACHPV